MALIPKIGFATLESEPLTTNLNFLSPLGFRFILSRTPNIEYFCQVATLPTISMTEINQSNPFVAIPQPGDRIVYEPFTLSFRVDEDMQNYLEIHDWLVGLGKPDNFRQYKEVDTGAGRFSDGSLLILSSNNNPRIRIAFEDMFPLSLSPLAFDVTQTDVEYLQSDVTFRYRRFTVEKL